MNNLILRRYAVKQLPLPSHTGQPVHKLVHNAMLDAANEAGLIPYDTEGQEQYHTFAKYRDQAHEELSNPNSPFTKLFNRHKSEISKVPNPQEHLKNALSPLFKYLGSPEESKLPLVSHSEHEEPVDLLHSGYSPYEVADKTPFEFNHTPSGFVEVPKGKKKPSPIRNDVYKSIAEHADMGWSAPDKLKNYLVKKHGITPKEASTHIANFRRKQNKPTAPAPTQTKRIWPPIQRKSRSKDLLDIPIFFSKKPLANRNSAGNKVKPAPRGWGSIDTRTPGGYEGWEKDFPDQIEDDGEGDTHEITLGEDEPIQEEPLKNSTYRAPKGGIVVRGSQYKGGETIPDMASSFISPRRSTQNKLKNII